MVFAKSDIGKIREQNQDYYYIPSSDSDLQLYILADGMGGYKGGEIASKMATEAVKEYVHLNFPKTEGLKERILELVRQAAIYANKVVFDKSKEVEELEGMGTTLEICLIYNNKAYIGHIGDSRIYRIRKEFIRKLTQDHSYVQKLVKEGKITKEQAEVHPQKNMLTRALGCNAFVEPDVMVKGFLKDDILVMCSDGLTNMVKTEIIYQEASKNIEQAPKELVRIANENGGKDNVTVVIIKNI